MVPTLGGGTQDTDFNIEFTKVFLSAWSVVYKRLSSKKNDGPGSDRLACLAGRRAGTALIKDKLERKQRHDDKRGRSKI